MANDFTFGAVNLANNTRTLVYSVPTSPSGQTAVIHSCTVANTHGTDSVDVTLEVYDTSGTTYYPVSSTVPVPVTTKPSLRVLVIAEPLSAPSAKSTPVSVLVSVPPLSQFA